MISLLLVLTAMATTFDVCLPDESCELHSIREALDLAQDGDLIRVGAGNWYESLYIDKAITIKGRDVEFPVLHANPFEQRAVLTIVGTDQTVVNLTNLAIYDSNARAVYIEGATLTLSGSTLSSGSAQYDGGLIYAQDATVSLLDSLLNGGRALHNGGLVFADNSEITVERSHFSDGRAANLGGAFALVNGTNYTEYDAFFFQNNAIRHGGAIGGVGAITLDLSRSDYLENLSDVGGAISLISDENTQPTVQISSTHFFRNSGLSSGGALSIERGSVHIQNSQFIENRSAAGGALAFNEIHSLELQNDLFCSNQAELESGGVFRLRGQTELLDPAFIRNSLFINNSASGGGGVLFSSQPGALEFSQNTFIENQARLDSAQVILNQKTDISLVNNFFGDHVGALFVSETLSNVTARLTGQHNAFWPSSGDLLRSNLFDSPVVADPLFKAETQGGCAFRSYQQRFDSPLRNSGDPSRKDLDDTRSDIGRFGGPTNNNLTLGYYFKDSDGDGVIRLYDCDRARADIYPGATEIYGDGVDQNCDERSDFDADLDGFDGFYEVNLANYTPVIEDCDDADPTIHPGATELANDGIDQDCDGSDLLDGDNDGFIPRRDPTDPLSDCDDTDPFIYPGAPEQDDDIDHDCDGLTGLPIPLQLKNGCESAPQNVSFFGLVLFGLLRRRRATL